MFTGIIETLGKVEQIQSEGSNINFKIKAEFAQELKVDQSVAHDGVCLTVVQLDKESYWVTAIDETLSKSALSNWKMGSEVNLERAMLANQRLDGHVVQGHVEAVAICTHIQEVDGSWLFTFDYGKNQHGLVVEKGSVAVNGISLTVTMVKENSFGVAIIPYTMEHTNLKNLVVGDSVNIEFDILGKYVQAYLDRIKPLD